MDSHQVMIILVDPQMGSGGDNYRKPRLLPPVVNASNTWEWQERLTCEGRHDDAMLCSAMLCYAKCGRASCHMLRGSMLL